MTATHTHTHTHTPAVDAGGPAAEPTTIPEGPPVLDIGGDVGALVVYLADQPVGGEIEACPVDDPAARFHTGVHRRLVAGIPTWTAVYPEVVEGTYHLLDEGFTPLATTVVAGGTVGYLDLR